MNPIIEVRDVSGSNHRPTKVFSTNIEINKTGHTMYHPSEKHTKSKLIKKFGKDIGGLMHFLLTFPNPDGVEMEHVYITSYSIVVSLKPHNNIGDWSPTIDKMIELSIKALAKWRYENSLIVKVEFGSNDKESRWFKDMSLPPYQQLMNGSHQRFWRPIRSMSQKYLRKLGNPWTNIIPSILKIPGVEEIETLGNAFKVEIGEIFVQEWDNIEKQILTILGNAFRQNVRFVHEDWMSK